MAFLRDRHGFTLIELMIVVVIIGLLAAVAIPNFFNLKERARAASVKSNCHTVQLVAEDFSVQNDGVYPANTAATTSGGLTMIDLLPWSRRLENPWTRVRTEPVDGGAARPGQTGYQPLVQTGTVSGYVIDGFGTTAVVLTLTSGQ
jgi:prepilin-type N-terminal cleavage/methylation domain-containing protein